MTTSPEELPYWPATGKKIAYSRANAQSRVSNFYFPNWSCLPQSPRHFVQEAEHKLPARSHQARARFVKALPERNTVGRIIHIATVQQLIRLLFVRNARGEKVKSCCSGDSLALLVLCPFLHSKRGSLAPIFQNGYFEIPSRIPPTTINNTNNISPSNPYLSNLVRWWLRSLKPLSTK